MNNEAIGRVIATRRATLGFPRPALAAALGLTAEELARVESGEAPVLAVQLPELCRLLEVDLVKLLRGAEDGELHTLGLIKAPKEARPTRLRAECAAALDVVSSELDACIDAFAMLRDAEAQQKPGQPTTHSVAYLESELIHIRALISFLLDSPDTTRPSDICRTDIVPDDSWVPSPPDLVDRLHEAKLVLHTTLAHITWSRTQAARPWPFEPLARDVVTLLQDWHDHAAATLGPDEARDSILTPLTVSLRKAWEALAPPKRNTSQGGVATRLLVASTASTVGPVEQHWLHGDGVG